MALLPFAAPACSVEIYPFEAGPVILSGGQIRSVTVSKSLFGGADGNFTIDLAPGGPLGVEDPLTWSQRLTPMSHCLIGMSRGTDAAIVMDGIVTSTAEDQTWTTQDHGSAATRGMGIAGSDFAWFYNRFNYYALTYFSLAAGIPRIGGGFLPTSLFDKLSTGLIGGTSSSTSNPVQVGRAWYDQVMAGSSGILSNTYVPFSGGSRYKFPATMAQVWENYPNVFIPYSDNFMTGAESWMAKFLAIFPHPWYEFFVTTAASDSYIPTGNGVASITGATFSMQSMPYAPPAGPVMVARVNPVPAFTLESSSGNSAATISSLDLTRWNALPLFDFTQAPYGFINSSVGFSATTASNFYQLNPTYYKTLAPGNNANTISVPFFYVAAADPASVQRYGFSPQIGTIRWMCDPNGTSAQNTSLNITQTILALTGRFVSWHHPAPLMLQGQVTLPLSPNVLIGTRFRYKPFKGGESWDFYVTSLQHRFVFGGQSTTRLTLSRGLPTTVYATAASDGILQAIYTGNAMRQNGTYAVGLPAGSEESLQVIMTDQQAASLTGHLAALFQTPQAGAS